MAEPVPAILCDVDGTLVDTTYLHTACWSRALSESGFAVPMVAVHGAIGMGADQMLPHLLGASPDPDLGNRLSARHDALFRAQWDVLQSTIGAAALLRAVAQRGLGVVLATSAGADELDALRRAIDADDAITAATSATDVASTKPAPDVVQRALQLAGVGATDALFIGDSVWDVHAANAAGVSCVALTCGGTCAEELTRAGAVAVYPDPAALLAGLRSSPVARLA